MIWEVVFVEVGRDIDRKASDFDECKGSTVQAYALLAEDGPRAKRQRRSNAENSDDRKADHGDNCANKKVGDSLGDALGPRGDKCCGCGNCLQPL